MTNKISIKRAYLDRLLDQASVMSAGTASGVSAFVMGYRDGKFYVFRSDKAVMIVVSTPLVKCEGGFKDLEFSLPSDKLAKLVKSFTDEFVSFFILDDKITFSCGEYTATWLKVKISEDVLKPDKDKTLKWEVIDAKKLVDAVDSVKYAASKDGVRQDLMQIVVENGVCWATDFYRFQSVVVDVPKTFKLHLPLAALDVLKFIKLSFAETVQISEDEDFYRFVVGEDMFLCRKPKVSPMNVKEMFLKYEDKVDKFFTAEVAQVVNIVKRIGITSERGVAKILITLSPNDVGFYGKDDIGNVGEEHLEAHVSGVTDTMKSFQVQTHWEYLVQALQAVNDKTAVIGAVDNFVTIKAEGSFGIVPVIRA